MPTRRDEFDADYTIDQTDQPEPVSAAQNAKFIAIVVVGVIAAVALAMVLSLA